MMTLEALKSFASREWSPSPGQVKNCSDELAADLINAGYARPVVKPEEKKAETVEVAKDENKSGNDIAAVPAAKGKRRRAKSK